MDYEALLRRYMQHVYDCEGTTFLNMVREFLGDFDADELAELRRMNAEVK